MSQTDIAVVLFAMFGSVGINLVRFLEAYRSTTTSKSAATRKQKGEVTYLTEFIYYLLQFGILPFLGGGLALAYQASGTSLTPLLAVNIGACAPFLFKTLLGGVHGTQGSIDRGDSVLTTSLTTQA